MKQFSEFEIEIENTRLWFLDNPEYSPEIANQFADKFYHLVVLLKSEDPTSANYGISCSSILDGVLRQESRV